MCPSFRMSLFLSPLALAVGALYLLMRANPAQPEPELLTEPWLLATRDEAIDRRSVAKRQVACALLDGRLTLRQAAAQFRVINADMRDKARSWHPPQYTEEEWPYRQVIVFVRAELDCRLPPVQAEEWVARLEAELREHLRQDAAPRPPP